MNQQKTGEFLKHLRRDKGLTQEQLAELFRVSSRTVSRWETGSNMPDLSILIELADYYDVDIREIIDGERKSATMDKETKDTLKKVAEYSDGQKKALKKRMIDFLAAAALLVAFCIILHFNIIPAMGTSHRNLMGFTLGFTLAALIINILYLIGLLDKLHAWKIMWLENRKKG